MHNKGLGVPQNYAEAFKWFRKAADQENAEAQVLLGYMYYLGQGVPQNYEEAVKWYLKAAEQGDAQAQGIVGDIYYNGEGVKRDFSEAAKWWMKAADQGNGNAQNFLGALYANGQGVKQDFSEAAKWFLKAADQGNTAAQCNLGLLYYNGDGVKRDVSEAEKWYRKAAAKGDAEAQNWEKVEGRKLRYSFSLSTVSEKIEKTGESRSLEEILRSKVQEALGKSNRGVERVPKFYVVNQIVSCYVAFNQNLTAGLTKTSAQMAIADVLKEIRSSGYSYSKIVVTGTHSLTDKFGNDSEEEVVRVGYKRATVDKINWGKFLSDNIYEIADDVWIHPAFR